MHDRPVLGVTKPRNSTETQIYEDGRRWGRACSVADVSFRSNSLMLWFCLCISSYLKTWNKCMMFFGMSPIAGQPVTSLQLDHSDPWGCRLWSQEVIPKPQVFTIWSQKIQGTDLQYQANWWRTPAHLLKIGWLKNFGMRTSLIPQILSWCRRLLQAQPLPSRGTVHHPKVMWSLLKLDYFNEVQTCAKSPSAFTYDNDLNF